ncbi:UNVERIFIED_ORG: hypothetical protein J2Y78_003180 [Buttiauxella agrestis ATCC 33320]
MMWAQAILHCADFGIAVAEKGQAVMAGFGQS